MQTTDDATEERLFSLVIEGQEMHVRFRPHWLSTGYGHLEFTSPYYPLRRISVSETGYHSHFSPMHEIEEAPAVALRLTGWSSTVVLGG